MDAIITAAGKNSRMIDDFKQRNKKPIHKLKLEINNKPILIHTIEKVVNADINNVTIALGHHKDEIYSLLKEYDLLDTVNIKINEDVNVGLSKTIENCIKDNLGEYYLFTAADQPTISTETINNMINTFKNAPNPKNTISVLARRKIGKLDSAEGLGMPFCCYGNLLYKYLANEDGNLNPILRKMIKNNVEFYGTPSRNELELKNINHYAEYEYIKEKLEK
ncbi:NTP transferase domain-containing protein [Methanosphaera sp. Vir-13MRS]|uniref:nucleotidyltransferase family protein n=1 Tax=Candidatus Methanosphaera massiliense TaxID=3017187 RepID=UPI00238007B3|nr:NTP transferase domain-containing protein [Candidatus Methanosphaera massiliense]MDE4077676.1 NTP transferase domain-containing protein [Candidatus Methanosphaera massiliense]